MPLSFLNPLVLRRCLALGLLLWLIAPSRAVGAQGVQDGYKTPTLVIPYAWKKPTLDGIVHEDEWQGAASLNAMQTTGKAVSARQTRFWLMWDEDTLYVAMRSPLRPGERLIQALRERDHDVNVVFDDSYEIWLDVGTHSADGQPVFFQYLANFAGARWDVMQEPAVGNSRLSWTAGWKPQNRLTPDGKFWEMELAIPRRSLYKQTPFQDGFAFAGLLARNFKRPWDQVTLAGSGSFSVRETYAHYRLSKNAPAIHLLGVGDPAARTFGIGLSAFGQTGQRAQTLRWRFDSDGKVHQEGTLNAPPGKLVALPSKLALEREGAGAFRIQVLATDGKTVLLDWSAKREWGGLETSAQALHDTGNRLDLTIAFNPARNYLRVSGDFINYDARNAITRCVLSARDSRQRVLAQKEVHMDTLAYARGVLPLPRLSPGAYSAELIAYDNGGHALLTRKTEFEQKDLVQSFPWWNTVMGNADKVISPWTPVRYANGRFNVWGREMTVGDAGLPTKIRAQGRDILAQPMMLVAQMADGTTLQAQDMRLRTLSQQPHRTVVEVQSRLGNIAVQSFITVEYDGMMKIEMRLAPKQATAIRLLRLIAPLRNEFADYLHACGEGIRYGFDYRFLSHNKRGWLWDSRSVDGQPMQVGSFLPYVWIGNPHVGLCWFADSDNGWEPNNRVPAIEVRRDSARSTDLVLNLISAPTTLKRPHHLTFAFQATPTRPLFPGWRMDTWWTNDTFKDWAQVESKGKAGNMGLIFSSIPFPLDPVKSREMVQARHRETSAIVGAANPNYHANAVPYFEHINMGEQFAPEMGYFAEEWRTRVSRGLSYGKTLADYMVYHVGNWARDCDIDGFYLDNVFPIADDNREAGRGYLLSDGRIQPTYQMFETRRYLLRLRAALAEQGKQNKLVLHITNHMIAPWIGAADIALDGEHHVIYPEMNKDFMDFWSLERLRVDDPETWGVAVNFLQEYQGAWEPQKLKKAMRAYTGMQLLQDTLASANANSLNPEVWRGRERFGIAAPDVRFLGYWEKESGLRSETKQAYVSAWLHPTTATQAGKLLLAVVNTGEKTTVAVQIDAPRMGLPNIAHWRAYDAETQEPLSLSMTGKLNLPMQRHNYRQVIVEPY